MEALRLLLVVSATLCATHLAAGADNGVWSGDDDRPGRHHRPNVLPPTQGVVFPPVVFPVQASNPSAPNLTVGVNVLESDRRQRDHPAAMIDLPSPYEDVRIDHDADYIEAVFVEGRESDPDYEAVEYERYLGPYHDNRYDEARLDHGYVRHDDDDDDDDRRREHSPEARRIRFADERDDAKLAERARTSFSDELEHDHQGADAFRHDAAVAEPEMMPDSHAHPALGQHAVHDLTDTYQPEYSDGDLNGRSHEVITLPNFMAPAAHSSRENNAVVMIGDVTPSARD